VSTPVQPLNGHDNSIISAIHLDQPPLEIGNIIMGELQESTMSGLRQVHAGEHGVMTVLVCNDHSLGVAHESGKGDIVRPVSRAGGIAEVGPEKPRERTVSCRLEKRYSFGVGERESLQAQLLEFRRPRVGLVEAGVVMGRRIHHRRYRAVEVFYVSTGQGLADEEAGVLAPPEAERFDVSVAVLCAW